MHDALFGQIDVEFVRGVAEIGGIVVSIGGVLAGMVWSVGKISMHTRLLRVSLDHVDASVNRLHVSVDRLADQFATLDGRVNRLEGKMESVKRTMCGGE